MSRAPPGPRDLYRLSVAIMYVGATHDENQIRLVRELERRGVAVLLVGSPSDGDRIGTAWLSEPFAAADLARAVRLVEEFAATGVVPSDRPERLTFAGTMPGLMPC